MANLKHKVFRSAIISVEKMQKLIKNKTLIPTYKILITYSLDYINVTAYKRLRTHRYVTVSIYLYYGTKKMNRWPNPTLTTYTDYVYS